MPVVGDDRVVDSRGSLRGAGSGLWLQSFDAQQAPDGAEADLPQATTTGDQLRDGGEPFGVVADAMDHLADRLRTLRSEHGSVLQAMIDAGHRAAQLAAQPVIDPAAATDAVQQAATLIARGAELITEVGTAHDEMQGVLTNPAPGQRREQMPDPPPGRESLEEILAEYQVAPDPDGTVSYPPFPLNLFKGSQTITTTLSLIHI